MNKFQSIPLYLSVIILYFLPILLGLYDNKFLWLDYSSIVDGTIMVVDILLIILAFICILKDKSKGSDIVFVSLIFLGLILLIAVIVLYPLEILFDHLNYSICTVGHSCDM